MVPKKLLSGKYLEHFNHGKCFHSYYSVWVYLLFEICYQCFYISKSKRGAKKTGDGGGRVVVK